MHGMGNSGEVEFEYAGNRYVFHPETLRVRREGEQSQSRLAPLTFKTPETDAGINFVTINVAHDCNMACPYCFAKQGLFGGERELMASADAIRIIDWLLASAGSKPDCYLRFLGGEPMMNLPVMRDAMVYGRRAAERAGKRLSFSVNTNGTIFTEEVRVLFEEFRPTISISIDGTREAHNVHRIFRSGKGTYDVVAKNVEHFLKLDPLAMVNGTLTAQNLDISEYVAAFRKLGFRLVRFAMVGYSDPGVAVRRRELLDKIRSEYDKIAESYLADLKRGDVWWFSDFHKYFGGLRARKGRRHRCGAGTDYLNIDVRGNIHLCHRFSGEHTQVLGNLQGAVNIPPSIGRMNQLDEAIASVPSRHPERPAGPERLVQLRLGTAARASASPALRHSGLDGRDLLGGLHGQVNPCALCDIRHLCGGSCFHDGQILFDDLHGGPDVFKCEVDRHLSKISTWLVDEIDRFDPSLFDELQGLFVRSVEHRN
jgi:sulfatase maturation enzyme AslB (radical SAM superfamily)